MDRQAGGGSGDVQEQDPDPWRDVEVVYEHAMRCRGRDDVEGACRLFQQVVDSGSAVPAQRAAFEIGKLLARQKDWAGALDAYRTAADLAADAKLTERAEIEAGLAVSALGAVSKEMAYWRTVASSTDKKAAAEAAYRVGVLLADRGEVRAARAAYRRAIASGDPFAASRAWEKLGRELADEGDRDGLVAAWQAAIAVGDPDNRARIAVNMAMRLRTWGKGAEARTAADFALTAASGHPEHMPRAHYELGIQLHNAGDLDGAREALQAAVDSGHPVTAPRAKAVLGSVLSRTGAHEQAKALLNEALASGEPEAVEISSVLLGTYFEKDGDLANAEASYRRAAAAVSSPQMGAQHLGRLLIRRGRPLEAEDWLRKAAEAGVPDGCAQLGRLLQSQDRLDEAEPWFRRALDQGDASVLTALADLLVQRHQPRIGTAARAHGLLGRTFVIPRADPFPVRPGVLDEAEQLYRRAIDAGDRGAPVGLATILFVSGRLDEAEECLRAAADAGDTQAMTNLARVRLFRDRDTDLEPLLEPAAQAGSGEASFLLAFLKADAGQLPEAEAHLRRAIAAGYPAATGILVLIYRDLGRTEDAERLLADARARNDTAALDSVQAWQRTWRALDETDPDTGRPLLDSLDDYRAVGDPAMANLFLALLTAGIDQKGRAADTRGGKGRRSRFALRQRPPTRPQ